MTNKTTPTLIGDIMTLGVMMALCAYTFKTIPLYHATASTMGTYTIESNTWGTAIFEGKKYGQYQFNGMMSYTQRSNAAILSKQEPIEPSITYNRDDILFSKDGTVYTEPQDSQTTFIEKNCDITITKPVVSSRIYTIPTNTIIIVNPHTSTVLTLQFDEPTQAQFNLDIKHILLPREVNTITVTYYTSLYQACADTTI